MAPDLSVLNPQPQRLPGPSLLHHLVATNDDRQNVAISYLSPDGTREQVSYAELHRRADRLATRLRSIRDERPSSPGTTFIVPLFIAQSPDLYVAQLATLNAGAAFCPLSLDVPEKRLRFILRDVDAHILLTTTDLRKSLPEIDELFILSADENIDDSTEDSLKTDVKPSSPAYVMYTSGSTGQPKGVILSHSAATQALLAHDRHIPSFSRFLQFASPTFDVSVFEIFFPLFRGATLICGERRRLLSDLPRFINEMNVDAAELTPSVASSLLRGRPSVPGLRTLLTIGEMLKRDVVEEFGGSADQRAILHGMYGPTEATIHCTLQSSFDKDMSVGNIGIPLDTVSALVVRPLDAGGDTTEPQILPIGEQGELAVGGYQLADGYLNRPEQTAAAFVEHRDYGLLYRTGDRAKMTACGKIECLGRISSGQIKLRGQRIELGEIEYAASKTPGCQSAVAEVVSGTLVVFLTTKTAQVNRSELFETCRKWLPGFMVPGDMMVLESLPYLASGKVDRNALQSIYSQQGMTADSEDEAISSRLRLIIDTINTVLDVSVGASSQLATAGLDSLSAIRIASQLRRSQLPGLDATALLEAQTPKEIDQAFEADERTREDGFRVNTERNTSSELYRVVTNLDEMQSYLDDIDDVFAPTSVQMEMLSVTARDSKAYCNWIEFGIPSTFEFGQIAQCLFDLATHHSLLRSGFLPLNDVNHTHALITWKALLPSQIQQVDTFDRDFVMSTERSFWRPLNFQIVHSLSETRILLRIHHSLYDQWSIDVFKRDLRILLHGGTVGATPTYLQLSQYSHDGINEARLDAATDFWQDQLREFSATLLPLMTGKRTPPALERTSWKELGHDVHRIRTAAQAIGCSVPAVFQAALAYLLGSYAGSSDATLGTVFSGRHIPIENMERMFGPCLSTLPLRLDYGATRSIRDLLRLTHDRNRAVQKHSHLPTSRIKSAASLAPDTKLFNVLFVWQETTFTNDTADSIVREVDSADEYDFSLVIEFKPSNSGVMARVTFQQSFITTQQVDIFLQQVRAIVEAMLKNPESLVEELPQSLPDTALSLWNINPTYCGPSHDLIRTIEYHALKSPNKPSLVFSKDCGTTSSTTQTLSYQDLNLRANRMAHYLQSLEKQPSGLICICMDKSVDLYVSMLATLKAGYGYLPLLPDVPPARLASIIAQSRIQLCICDTNTSKRIRECVTVDMLDVTAIDTGSMPSANLRSTISGSDVAYTVYTSGSTGKPKGVAVTASNLLGNLQALAELYQVESGDRLLQACSQAFDVSAFEIFFSFYTGICLCSAPKDVLFADLEASIRNLEITHLSLTPTVAALVLPANVPQVKFLVTAGEAVTELVHQKWVDRGLHQGYGPSETTNICTINMNIESDDVLGNIGLPFRNTSAMVLAAGPGFDVLPAGAVGEFAFGGEQVFKGYVGMDELNAQTIINHPRFGRVYKSGDIGRILHDGTLLISGRLDDQIQIRGNRIELGEINAALLRGTRVRDCTTLVVGESAADLELVSFVVLHSSLDSGSAIVEALTTDSDIIEPLFSQLEDAVPSYMLPSIIVPVNRLPLTTQGKLDRRSLRGLLDSLNSERKTWFSRRVETSADDGEWTDTERMIASTLANGLCIPSSSISRNISFFGLGLNSLNAISFAKHLSRSFGTHTNSGLILRYPTISRLARHLDCRAKASTETVKPDKEKLLPENLVQEVLYHFRAEEVEDILPCTPLQEVMISTSSISQSAYCNTTWLDVSGSMARLKRCWKDMVERHPILRTRFVETESPSHPVVQVVMANATLPWTEQNSQSLDDLEERQAKARTEISGLAPFKIDFFTSSQGAKLALHVHHASYDGISMALLLHEVESRYKEEALPPVPSFAEFLRESRAQNSQQAMAFWSSRLGGLRPSPFPQSASTQHSQEHILQPGTFVQQTRLDSYCRRHGVTRLALFQAALVKLLSHLQAITDVCIGNVVSGRTVPVGGIERLVAPCFNTIPVRADTYRTRSNMDLIRHLAHSNAESVDYQLTPLRRLQTLSADPSKRLFDALLLLQPSDTDLDDRIWSLERDVGSMGLPLVFEISPSADDFELTIHHLDATISPTLAEKISQAFVAALQSCLEYPASGTGHFQGEIDAESKGSLAPAEETIHLNGRIGHDAELESHDWNAEEALVRDVFARLSAVKINRISKDKTMYQLGLDSLNAPQIASQLRSKGYEVDAADIMEALTPRSIARSLLSTQHTGNETSIDLEAFDRRYRDVVLESLQEAAQDVLKIRPSTSVQNGMLAQSLQSQGDLYVNHMTYKIPETITASKLHAGWTTVMHKHELLRAGFLRLRDAQWPFAIIVRRPVAADVPLKVADCQSLKQIEQSAKEAVMRKLESLPWHITLTSGQMTISMHHALFDAESLRIFLVDLQHSLNSGHIGKPIDIDPLLTSTILSERQALKSSAAESFWSSKFENVVIAKLPDLNPTAAVDSNLAVEVLPCSVELSRVEHYCREHGATIQALGQTAFALLLAAYTGESTTTFGTVFSGRNDSSAWQTGFPSVVTVPVVCDTDRPHEEVVEAMVDYNASAQRYRFTPLADIQRLAGHPGRSIFDTVFVYQKITAATQECVWSVVRETAGVDYAASLELETNSNTNIQFRLTFDTGRIPQEQARHMIQQYNLLLQNIVLGISTNNLSANKLFSSVAPKISEIPSDVRLMQQFVERGAAHYPDRVAFEFVSNFDGDRPVLTQWTYAELNDISNRAANAILDAGVREGSVVALCMDKCPEATFAFVGILKAGCAFLALDPALPQDRVTFILEDSSSTALLTAGLDRILTVPNGVQLLDISLKGMARFANTAPSVPACSSNETCYVLYTSGTTGTPKGCEITHENAVQAMLAFQRLFAGHWTEKSRWLQFASYWFDVSVLEQFWSWSVGISVVGAPRDLVLEDISAFIRALNITQIDLTPSLARLVHPDEVPSLLEGVFITGGEALKQEIIDAWGSKHTLCNGYGPTEATIGVTMSTFVSADAKPSNIGKAFDNVGAYILSPDGHTPVIRGGVGELCVSGKLVGKGYLNRPQLTAKQFPFVPELGERIYRTGDLARLLSDNSFQFIGRKDSSQQKLRGQRVETEEIDSVIRKSANNVGDVLSLVVRSDSGKETLLSFLTSDDRNGFTEPNLDLTDRARSIVQQAQSACEQKLAGYMIPTHIIPLTLLPLTVNKKVDAKRLSTLFGSLDTRSLQNLKQHGSSAHPLNSSERKVCQVLAEMFPVDPDQTESNSNLFSMGLSSISAISFAGMLKHAGFSRANVAMIMRTQTIDQLAAALTDTTSRSVRGQDDVDQAKLAIKAHSQRYLGAAVRELRLRAEEIETVTPCTPLQQGLILESLKDASRPYFNQFVYKLHNVDLDRLEQACRDLTERVQVLRSSFVGLDEGHSQIVRKRSHVRIARWNTSPKSLEALLLEKKRHWVESNSQDLTTPCEIHVARASGSVFLAVHVHHSLYDAIAFELIMQLLWQIYLKDEPVDIGPLFTDALSHGPLKHTLGSENFWKRKLDGCDFVSLVSRYAGSASDPRVYRSLQSPAVLEQRRQELGVSHQAMSQAAFEVALRQTSFTQHTQTYGIVVSGRSIELEGADQVLGPMFNTLPQPVKVHPHDTLSNHIRGCHKMNVETLPYQHTPLKDIRKWASMRSGGQLFDVLFVFQHRPTRADESRQGAMELYTPLETPSRAEYPLVCEIELHNDGPLGLTLLAQSEYFSERDLQFFMSDLVTVFDTAASDPDANLGKRFNIQDGGGTSNPQRPENGALHINGAERFEWSKEASVIRSIVAELAGLEIGDVDEHTSIFSLGLDSIDAVKLASRLRNAGLLLPVSEILRARTIPRMLHRIQAQNDSNNGSKLSRLKELGRALNANLNHFSSASQDVERILPTTPTQEALIADMLRSDFEEYLNNDVLQLDSRVDISRLKAAWQTVIDASPVLRTSFFQVTDPKLSVVFAQVVHRAAPISVAELHLSSINEIDDYIRNVRKDVSANLKHTPPLRLAVAFVGQECYLIVSMAHAMYDGHSLALLHEDIQRAYAGTFKTRPSYDVPIDAALTAAGESSRQFWSNALSGYKPQAFPQTNVADEDNKLYRSEVESKLSLHSVRSFCQHQGVSMQALAQACWALTLAHYTQALEVLFGVVLACRDSEEAESIMFPMMNTVVMRSSLHGRRTDMLRYMQSAITEMLPYQRTPLRSIQKAYSGVVEDAGNGHGGALFDTLFIYQHRPNAQEENGEPLYQSVGGSSSVDYPVAVEMEATGHVLSIRAACKSSILSERGTKGLVDHLDQILQSIVAHADEPTVELSDGKASICGLAAFDLRPPELRENVGEGNDMEKDERGVESSPVVMEILKVFAQVSDLPASDLSPKSTIESIGIDSISAIKVASLLRKKDIKLSVSDIIRAKSAVSMAELVSKRSGQPAERPRASKQIVDEVTRMINVRDAARIAGFDPEDVESVLPATAGQVYILSMWMKTGGQIFYPTFTYQIRFNVDESEIRTAWTKLVEQHPILRTVFVASKNKDILGLQLVIKSASALKTAQQQPLVSFDVRQCEAGYELQLRIHHCLYDAVFLSLLMQDLGQLLASKPLSESKLKQEDLVALSATEQARSRQKDFWTKYMQNITPIKLSQAATDGPQTKIEIFQPGLFSHTGDLNALARREGISVQALLFAAYAKVYTSFPAKTGSIATDVVLGTYLSNRSHLPDLDSLAVPTLNLVPLLVRSPRQRDLLEVATKIQRDLQEIGTPENSSTSLWKIADWTGVKIDTFVNFLKLPERSNVDDEDEDNVKIEEVNDQRLRARREVVDAAQCATFEPPPELRDMQVTDAYQHSVDIEMTVTDGKLDVGLFAPVEMISLAEADAALAEMKEVLEGVVGKVGE